MDTNGHITLCEDYVSFEVEKLLEEKGFNKSYCTGYAKKSNSDGTCELIRVCTHQMACKWLRELHNIYIMVFRYDDPAFPYIWYIFGHSKEKPQKANSYEGAIEAALKCTLENLI